MVQDVCHVLSYNALTEVTGSDKTIITTDVAVTIILIKSIALKWLFKLNQKRVKDIDLKLSTDSMYSIHTGRFIQISVSN